MAEPVSTRLRQPLESHSREIERCLLAAAGGEGRNIRGLPWHHEKEAPIPRGALASDAGTVYKRRSYPVRVLQVYRQYDKGPEPITITEVSDA